MQREVWAGAVAPSTPGVQLRPVLVPKSVQTPKLVQRVIVPQGPKLLLSPPTHSRVIAAQSSHFGYAPASSPLLHNRPVQVLWPARAIYSRVLRRPRIHSPFPSHASYDNQFDKALGCNPNVIIQRDAIQDAISRVPASLQNTLLAFISNMFLGVIEMNGRMQGFLDPSSFWELRRVQCNLRRLLEFLVDRFSLSDVQDVAEATFKELRAWAGSSRLSSETFIKAMTNLQLWPAEFTPGDKQELTAALQLPSTQCVKAAHACRNLPSDVTEQAFHDCLAKLPYSIPDFPCCEEDLRSAESSTPGLERIALDVALAHTPEEEKLNELQDFFLSGFVSLESIQSELPYLASIQTVEDAVVLVITVGAARFTPHEWEVLVYGPRAEANLPTYPLQDERYEAHGSKEPSSQVHAEDAASIPRASGAAPPDSPKPDVPQVISSKPSYLNGPLTEPTMPCRDVRSEQPVNFLIHQEGRHVVNWDSRREESSAKHESFAEAEVGPQTSSDQTPSHPLSPLQKRIEPPEGSSVVAHMSLTSQNDGPFLATAFLRCCTLYKAAVAETENS